MQVRITSSKARGELPRFWSKNGTRRSKGGGSGSEQIGPGLHQTLDQRVRETLSVRDQQSHHPFSISHHEGSPSSPPPHLNHPSFDEPTEVDGKPTFAQPGPSGQLGDRGFLGADERHQEPPSGSGPSQSQEPPVSEGNFGHKIMVLGTAPFPMDKPGLGQSVKMVGGLSPSGGRGPLNFSCAAPRGLADRGENSTPSFKAQRVVFHRSRAPGKERGGEKEQSHDEDQDQDGQGRRGPRWRRDRQLSPDPEAPKEDQTRVRAGEEQESCISRPNVGTGRQGRVDAGHPCDEDGDKQLEKAHEDGHPVRRFKELVQRRNLLGPGGAVRWGIPTQSQT